jgi:hypothetical protein
MNILKISILYLLLFSSILFGQGKDTLITSKPKKDYSSPGGLFITPSLGMELPMSGISGNSNMALSLGAKLEYSSIKIYPFVLGISFQVNNHNGSEEYRTINLLNTFTTKITSFGISVDFLLAKFLKTKFTVPFFILEGKYFQIQREISPEKELAGILKDESGIGVTAGAGFTLYIFDIIGTYSYFEKNSTIGFKTRIRVPIIKF